MGCREVCHLYSGRSRGIERGFCVSIDRIPCRRSKLLRVDKDWIGRESSKGNVFICFEFKSPF